MAFLNSGATLEDALGKQAQSASAAQTDAYQQARKRTVAQQAAGGRLMSGVSNYPLTDLDVSNQQDQSAIQDKLAGSLAGIGQEDWLNRQKYLRSYGLADKIGNANKPSSLDELFQGIGSIGPLVAMGAAL